MRAALVALAILTAGCDRQKPGEPQGKAPAASPERQRYHIDEAQAGTPLPSAQVTSADGSQATLGRFKGKPLLVNLWATWCAPCVEELPTLDRLAASVGDKAVVLTLSQDIGADSAPVRAFLEQRGWSHVTSWYDPLNSVGLAYGGALPTTLIYDAKGHEVARVSGPLDWNGAEARALLAKAGFPG